MLTSPLTEVELAVVVDEDDVDDDEVAGVDDACQDGVVEDGASVEGGRVVVIGTGPGLRQLLGVDGGGGARFHSATGTISGGFGTTYPSIPVFRTSISTSLVPHTPLQSSISIAQFIAPA